MRKISTFNFISLDGFYKDNESEISWHIHGEEGIKFSEMQLEAENILLFGRKTYEMMYGFWTSEMAFNSFPKIADKMNSSDKILISNTIKKSVWNKTTIFSGDIIEQLRNLKSSNGKNISILGSGDLISQLTNERLIDEYQFLIDPIIIGDGYSIFKNLKQNLNLKLIDTQILKKSGSILLKYEV